MNNPIVSIVIPVFNVESYLRECLDSVCRQSLRDIEIICIDDGSTDSSLLLLNDYAAKDPRISVMPRQHEGLAAIRNLGLDTARGTYLYFIDADDILPDAGMLADLVALCEKDALDQVIFAASTFPDERNPPPDTVSVRKRTLRGHPLEDGLCGRVMEGRELLAELHRQKCFAPCMCLRLMRTNTLRAANLRFLNVAYHEDDFFTPAAMLASKRALALNRILYHRRLRGGSIMTRDGIMTLRAQSSFKNLLAWTSRENPPPDLTDSAERLCVQHLFKNLASRYAQLDEEARLSFLAECGTSERNRALLAGLEVRVEDRLQNSKLKRQNAKLKRRRSALKAELRSACEELKTAQGERDARPNSIRQCLAFIVRQVSSRIRNRRGE